MTTIKMDMHQWSRWMTDLGVRFKPAALRGMRSGGLRCVHLMQQRTSTAPPASPKGGRGAVNLGLYKAAWKTSEIPNGTRVYNDRPYSPIIDRGRRPGLPVGPGGVRNLEAWARRKLKLTGNAARAAAFAIAKSIEKRGLLPRRVMSGAEKEMVRLVEAEVTHELDLELKR